MSSPGFWNPRSNPPQSGLMYKVQKKEEQSFWYPRLDTITPVIIPLLLMIARRDAMNINLHLFFMILIIRQYDMSSVAWGNKELWSQKDPPDEIQYTYWKKPAPKNNN